MYMVIVEECIGCDLCVDFCFVDCIDMVLVIEIIVIWKWDFFLLFKGDILIKMVFWVLKYLSFDYIIELLNVGKLFFFFGGVYFDDKKLLFNIELIVMVLMFDILVLFLC